MRAVFLLLSLVVLLFVTAAFAGDKVNSAIPKEISERSNSYHIKSTAGTVDNAGDVDAEHRRSCQCKSEIDKNRKLLIAILVIAIVICVQLSVFMFAALIWWWFFSNTQKVRTGALSIRS